QPKKEGIVRMETPAGLVVVEYTGEPPGIKNQIPIAIGTKIKKVRLTNVPAFLHSTELKVDCPGLGDLVVDVAYGGNFYAIVDVQKNFKGLEHYSADKLIACARVLWKNINSKFTFIHPADATINACSHILWAGAVLNRTSAARNAVFYGEKAIDRSPCGTGT